MLRPNTLGHVISSMKYVFCIYSYCWKHMICAIDTYRIYSIKRRVLIEACLVYKPGSFNTVRK